MAVNAGAYTAELRQFERGGAAIVERVSQRDCETMAGPFGDTPCGHRIVQGNSEIRIQWSGVDATGTRELSWNGQMGQFCASIDYSRTSGWPLCFQIR